MRGCLFVLLVGVALLAGGFWFGAPPLAEFLVRSTLETSGFASDEPAEVEIQLDSPLDLIAGRAERVTVRSLGPRFAGVTADSADVVLGRVDLLGGRFETIDLILERPTIQSRSEAAPLAAERLTAAGPVDAATTRMTIRPNQFLVLVHEPFRAAFGAAPTAIAFGPPDRLTVTTATSTFESRFRVEGGGLVIAPALGEVPPVEIFRPGSAIPLVLDGLEVVGGDLVLLGRLDLSGLLR
jgi:hypothetical protein